MERQAGELTTLWRDDATEDDDRDDQGAAALFDLTTTEATDAPDVVPARTPAQERRRERRQYAQGQRRAREAALQVLFEVDLVGHDVTDVRERQFDQMILTDGAREFAGRLVEGVLTEREALDTQIAALAPAWPVAQLPRVDVNVLRLALYEMGDAVGTPPAAAVNEAVELAKQYGSENSGRFVNGVLGSFTARRERDTETHPSPTEEDASAR